MNPESSHPDAITLDCEECHLETVFPHEDLMDDTLLICSHCGADHGTWITLKKALDPLVTNLALDIGGEEFEGVPGFTPAKLG
jgi:hypothetical protein